MQKVQLRGKVIFSLVIYYNFSLYVRNRILVYLYVHRNSNYMYFGVLDIVAYTYSYPRTYYHKLRTIIKLSTLLLLIMYRRTHSYTGQSYYKYYISTVDGHTGYAWYITPFWVS